MKVVRDILAAHLLRDQHRATLVLGNTFHTLDTNKPAANISAGSLGSVQVKYDGLQFVVTGLSGSVAINNIPSWSTKRCRCMRYYTRRPFGGMESQVCDGKRVSSRGGSMKNVLHKKGDLIGGRYRKYFSRTAISAIDCDLPVVSCSNQIDARAIAFTTTASGVLTFLIL